MGDIVINQPVRVQASLNYFVANGERPLSYAYDAIWRATAHWGVSHA
ncbi:hypothetical protein [Paraburkholderia heleia]